MVYVKRLLAGLIALIVVPICLFVVLMVGMLLYASLHQPTSGEGSIGWDPVSLWRSNPVVWLIPVLMFLAGFGWEYRRLTK
jgi:hypothetical protein